MFEIYFQCMYLLLFGCVMFKSNILRSKFKAQNKFYFNHKGRNTEPIYHSYEFDFENIIINKIEIIPFLLLFLRQ